MRASRLVQLRLFLQARGRTTASVLARELEVSERTIHRDVDALSAAGVPIYAERGPHGGIQLIDGYRTRLTGLTGPEAEALFLSGLPGPAAELGLGTVMAAARLKVLAALPSELRARASRLVERFHLDAAGWFRASEDVPQLAALAEAVWGSRRVAISYRRGDRAVERTIEPLGLVLKAGIWYLVAGADGQIRTYRVSRVERASTTDEPMTRPPDFDLAAYWADSISAYERESPRVAVTIRIDPAVIEVLAEAIGGQAVRGAETLPAHDPDGWLHLRVTADWPDEVPGRLIGLGGRAEILDPPEIRQRAITLATGMLERHGAGWPSRLEGAGDRGDRGDHKPAEQEDDGHDQADQAHQDQPLARRRGLGLLHVPANEREIPRVGLEPQVECVTDEWDCPDRDVDDRVHEHPGHDHARNPEPRAAPHDEQADHAARQVTDHRHEADQRVDAEAASAGSRDRDAAIQEPGERLDLAQRARSVFRATRNPGDTTHGVGGVHVRCPGTAWDR